jgi:hypothetical protein
MDSETMVRRRAGRKLRHRAAQLRKTADELDAIAVQIETGEAAPREGADQTDQGKTAG